jgi:glycosyltransferase involved in cell wall biosynthesis
MAHIAIDHRLTWYRKGGISTYISRLTKALALLDGASRHQWTVLPSRKDRDFSAPAGFHPVPLWTPCHHRIERLALSVELARLRLDVLHSPDFIPPYRGARRHVITVHDLTFLHYPQYLTAESRRYYNGQITAAVRHADHILTDSESSRRDMMTMLGVPGETITVHMLGVDEHFRPPDADAIAAVTARETLPDRYWLALGTFEPRKNIIGLLDAYRQIADRFPEVPPLLLAGTRGWLYEETLAHIDALGLASHVQVRENVPRDALPVLYARAIAVVTPSFYEGFGLPALEGMACGTVPIVSNRSSLPEVVGDVGLQIEPEDTSAIADAMLRAWQDDAWRTQQIQAGLARAAGFRWEATARIALAAYERVL